MHVVEYIVLGDQQCLDGNKKAIFHVTFCKGMKA